MPDYSPREVMQRLYGRPRTPAPHVPALERHRPPLGNDASATAASAEWQVHLDAGRIGVAPPAPPPGEYRLASLAALVGRAGR